MLVFGGVTFGSPDKNHLHLQSGKSSEPSKPPISVFIMFIFPGVSDRNFGRGLFSEKKWPEGMGGNESIGSGGGWAGPGGLFKSSFFFSD